MGEQRWRIKTTGPARKTELGEYATLEQWGARAAALSWQDTARTRTVDGLKVEHFRLVPVDEAGNEIPFDRIPGPWATLLVPPFAREAIEQAADATRRAAYEACAQIADERTGSGSCGCATAESIALEIRERGKA